jgi:amino acid adenylation domain-containing protein
MAVLSSARTLVEFLLEGAARVSPGKNALQLDNGAMTFGDLLRGARGIATTLHEAGIGRGDRVGIWMDKSPACVQSVLGVLFSGAAYVPLDPRSPWRRCRTIALDCGFAGIVIDEARVPLLREFLEGQSPRLILLDDSTGGSLALPDHRPISRLCEAASHAPVELQAPEPSDIAYVLYTSGSTGTPKGVVHTHASGLAFARWIQQTFEIRPDDVFSSHAPFHFDLSISDLFASLGTGASVRLISSTEAMLAPYLVRKITEWGITVWYSVPSILVSMLDKGRLEELGLPTVRVLFFAGEVFPTLQLRRLRKTMPHTRLVNLFGPTETNVCTSYEVPAELPEGDNAPIPIGKACDHMETFVLDDDGHEVGVGIEGTLWARDGNVMHSYWNDAERTASTLRPDPRGRPGRAYCTGDRVRLRPDGSYDFLGRRDHMIKTRGYRVELGEVEATLASHPDAIEAVVIPLPDEEIGNRLIAVVVPRSGAQLNPPALRAFCRSHLSTYMVPDQIDVRPELPRTSTGKADRTALRAEWEPRRRAS